MNRTLQAGLRAVQRRRRAIGLALLLPPALALAWLAGQRIGAEAALPVLAAAVIAYGAWLAQERRRCDLRWYARALNTADRRFDDSAELLLADSAALPPLAQLQQRRLHARAVEQVPDLRPAWPPLALLGSVALAGVILLLSLWSPHPDTAPSPPPHTPPTTTAAAVRLVYGRLESTPPRYTGIAPNQDLTLDARVPDGTLLHWQLELQPPPRAARLRFHDGRTLELTRDGVQWSASSTIAAAALYRIEIDADTPLAESRRYRLDVIADAPPQIRVDAPDRTLSLRESTQNAWDFDIRASDDYGLGEATLEIVRAQGSGENISVKRASQRLRGEGSARERRYRHRIDLAALELSPGDEVIEIGRAHV